VQSGRSRHPRYLRPGIRLFYDREKPALQYQRYKLRSTGNHPALRLSIQPDRTQNVLQTVASIISLLNDYRLSTGRRPLGFLNPWLYCHGRRGITDNTSGSNPGCGTEGFPAIVGWDPVRPARGFPSHSHCLLIFLLGR
jgi:hypothetical protein